MLRPYLRALVVVTGAGMVTLALLPWFLAGASADPATRWIASLDQLLLRPFCHQLPARCLWFDGASTALCARCLGLFVGGLLAGLAAIDRWRTRFVTARRMVVPTLALLALDVALQAAGLYFSLTTRLVTGILAGGATILAGLTVLDPAGIQTREAAC